MTLPSSFSIVWHALCFIIVFLSIALVLVASISKWKWVNTVLGIPKFKLSWLKGLSKTTSDPKKVISNHIDVIEICSTLNARTDDLSPKQIITAYLQDRVPKHCTITVLITPDNPDDKNSAKNLKTATYQCHGKNFLKKGSVVKTHNGIWQPPPTT